MLYDIRLVIRYTFGQPTGAGRQHLRLLPAWIPGQQHVVEETLSVTPTPSERREFLDFFGNRVIEIALAPGQKEVKFDVRARVHRLVQTGGFDLSPPLARLPSEIEQHRSLGAHAPHHGSAASPRVPMSEAITAYARAAIGAAETVRQAVEALGLALHTDMTFDSEATEVDTAPEEAFAGRRGVCQDFAQIMIAGLRGLGIPAGYVSGFLRTLPPPGKPRLEGADAMHAWVRAWCGAEAGWMEYDPTNACLVGLDHIVVAYGRDYGDIAPVAGVLRLGGSQTSKQAVDILALDET
jgi:transglutaminase-like putative cysteine protease